MNYIQKIYDTLDIKLKMRGTEYEGLLETYGLLVMAVGTHCTQKHIHDAWSIWQNKTQPNHRSLIPFDELTKEVQELDEPYRVAVAEVARELGVVIDTTLPTTLQIPLNLDEYRQVMGAMIDRAKVEGKILTVEEYAKMVLLEVSGKGI